MKKKWIRLLVCAAMVALIFTVSAVPAFAAGDVAGAIEQTWNTAKTQIQTVVNNGLTMMSIRISATSILN